MIDKMRQLETFARAGWFARGVVYCLLAYLALTGAGASDASPQGVFRSVQDMPAGKWLLGLLALGLALYGAYRVYSAALDSEGKGDDAKGIAVRIGYAASGFAHFFLAYAAIRLAAGQPSGGDGETEQRAAGMMLDIPLGQTILGALGVAFLAAAAHQLTKAWTTEFMKDMAAGAPRWVVPVGRAGLVARAVVFATIGVSLLSAGWFGAAGEVKGLGDALYSLTDHPELYSLVAIGLFMFGVHSFVDARWRRIRNEDMVSVLKARAARR
ncbi:MAG: DUF1206 domain-containing protein [Blastomonas fulva]|jgi:hypothetical protein|uniref:DUF1206 domain-containing protein n=1 Tax=Blastomonas fulva TaxID=1550728 RepID=UPI0040348E2B